MSLVLFCIGVWGRQFVWLPWSIQAGCVVTLYLYVGQILREYDVLQRIPKYAWIIISGIWVAFFVWFGHLYLVTNNFADGVAIDLVGSIDGALSVIKISEVVAKRVPAVERPLAYIGRITLAILCAHVMELDLNVLTNGKVVSLLERIPVDVWISSFLLRLVVVALICVLLRVLPKPISCIFYPHLRAIESRSAA